jgi:hypothetical protein
MGVWGAGNFANDAALDYAHELVDAMVQQIAEAIASEHGMEPDEDSSTMMVCNVELMCVIGRHVGISMVKAAAVESWKEAYLKVWDGYIDRLKPVPGFKEERHGVIVETFDRLIELCRQREG